MSIVHKVPYDLEKIRQEAQQSTDKGAVTDDYPLDLEQACELLNSCASHKRLCVSCVTDHQSNHS